MKSALADQFIREAKDCYDRDKFFQFLNQQEQAIHQDTESNINAKLFNELRMMSGIGQTTQQPVFLNTSQGVEQNYMHSQAIYHQQMRADSSNLNIIAQHELTNHQNHKEFAVSDRNFLDVNANSKFYHPEKPDFGMHQPQIQYSDQSNANLLIQERTTHYNLENPELKNVYPRGVVSQLQHTMPIPESIKNQEKNSQLKSTMSALGGYRDTVEPMRISLETNEQRNFRHNPQNSYSQFQQSARDRFVPPPPPPEPQEVIDPFNRNPQYQMRALRTNIVGPSFDITSYIPESKINNPQNDLGFLEEQRKQRQQYSQMNIQLFK